MEAGKEIKSNDRAFTYALGLGVFVYVVAFAMSTFMNPYAAPMHVNASIWAALFGLQLGLPTLFSIYLHFGREPVWKRFLFAGAASLACYVVWFFVTLSSTGLTFADLGLALIEWFSDPDSTPTGGLGFLRNAAAVWFFAFATLTVSMAAVWVGRAFAGWRLSKSSHAAAPLRLSVGQLLLVTALVAVAVACFQVNRWIRQQDDESVIWTIIPLVVVGILSTIVQVVGLWTLLRLQNFMVACLLAILPLLIAPAVALVFHVVGGPEASTDIIAMSFAIGGFVLFGYLPMLLLRWYGYRIYAGRPVVINESVSDAGPID